MNNIDIDSFGRHISMHGTVYSRTDVASIQILAVDYIREQMHHHSKSQKTQMKKTKGAFGPLNYSDIFQVTTCIRPSS